MRGGRGLSRCSRTGPRNGVARWRDHGLTSTQPAPAKRAPAGEPDDHASVRSRGGLSTKIHLAAMARLRVPRRRGRPRATPDLVLADKAYSSRAIREHLRRRGIRAVIPVPAGQRGHRLRRGSRGGRPPAFDPESYKRRWSVQVVTDPGGRPLWLSPALPGRAFDLTAARTHRIIRICERQGVPILADLAYQGGGPWASTGIERKPPNRMTATAKAIPTLERQRLGDASDCRVADSVLGQG
ncbi:transposase [Streptomyces griseofuscus]|uniref:transposase n=1 Tax=Streptomyces griseofuscus TaxID=146922 RepID=UPI00313449E2